MGLNDLVQVEDLADRDAHGALLNLPDKLIEGRLLEFLRPTIVDGQAGCAGDAVHRTEVVEGPFVAHHARHADNAVAFDALQRIFEGSLRVKKVSDHPNQVGTRGLLCQPVRVPC